MFSFIVGFVSNMCCVSLWFFFFKQKTAYEMRISDWSSDVCSSDLRVKLPFVQPARQTARLALGDAQPGAGKMLRKRRNQMRQQIRPQRRRQIGRASCRERVCQYV